MASSSIVRFGPTENNLCAKLLRTALISHFYDTTTAKNNDDSDNVDCESNNNEKECATIDETDNARIVIVNKYFTANVLLEGIGEETSSRETSTSCTKEDGVILIFDALQSNPDRIISGGNGSMATFDGLDTVHRQAETVNNCGDLLRLCIGVSLGDYTAEELRGKDHEKEYSRRILWCLDNGYEYIEADLSKDGQMKGHDERDKDGFARIVEAIEGTVWSSAVMSKSKTQELKNTYVDDKNAVEKETPPVGEEEEEEEENPYQPPDPSLLFKSQNDVQDQTISTASSEDVPAAAAAALKVESEAASMLLNPTEVGPSEMAQLRQDLEAEKIFDKMESVLKEASQIREASKSGALSDDERRERAGDAALALVNLMSQFGLEDDDDGSQGDDSDDDSGVADNPN
jgi:hypothetical protein